MPLLAIGKLYLEHVFCMLDAIKQCSSPLQIARKDGKIWSFLYVSYDTEELMREALHILQDYVKKTWGIYSKCPPFICAADDVDSMVFTIFVKDTPVGMHSHTIVAHFEQDTDLLAWSEIEVVRNLGGFFVNFLDFEDAMKYVRRAERNQLFVQGKLMYIRPQKNLIIAIKLFAHMQNMERSTLSIEDVQDVCSRFFTYIDSRQVEVMMQCLLTVFEKVTLDTTTEYGDVAFFYRLRDCKEFLLQTYRMHRIQQLEYKMQDVLPVLVTLFQQTISRIAEREGVGLDATFENSSVAMKTMLQECTILFQQNSNTWTTSQVIIGLCTEVIRTELKKTDNISTEKAYALWSEESGIFPQILADEHLKSYKKIRCAGYRDMLKNPIGNLVCAMKALHICLDIVTWNAYVSHASFECLCNIIHHSNDVIMAAIPSADEHIDP